MKLFHFLTIIMIFMLIMSCTENNANKTSYVTTKIMDTSLTEDTNLDTITKEEDVDLKTLLDKFPKLNNPTKFIVIDSFPESLTELSQSEAYKLSIIDNYKNDLYQNNGWYIMGKTESKSYFSLYLYQNLECLSLYQANYNKKDSSLIQLFLLGDNCVICHEYSSTKTIKNGNQYIQNSEAYYETWSESGGGRECNEYVTSIYQIQENGKIDSVSSETKLDCVKVKSRE